MKKQALGIVLALCCMTMLATVGVRAQAGMVEGHATMPFDFIINGRTLPAGAYTFARVAQSERNVLKLSRADGSAGVLFITSPVVTIANREQPKLVFRRYGDQYFLAQIWSSHDNTIRELSKCRRERELVREVAKHTMPPRENVSVALNRR